LRGRRRRAAGTRLLSGPFSAGNLRAAFLEGRISEEQLINFRREVDGKGISSYPHPWLMQDFWQFATVSMGLGPLQAIYQARYMRYLHDRPLRYQRSQVWGFLATAKSTSPSRLPAWRWLRAKSSTT